MPRPLKDLEGFYGQRRLVTSLERMVAGSLQLDRPMPHLLFVGRPGGGKTRLAKAVASACGSMLRRVPATEVKVRGLSTVLAETEARDFVFIDEAHTLRPNVLMMLNTALDDHLVPDPSGKLGTELIDVPEFTLVIATNRVGELDRAFRSRFQELVLEEYTLAELKAIVISVAEDDGLSMTAQAARRMAETCDGSPRLIKKNLVRLGLHYAGAARINQDMVERFLVDDLGLDEHGLQPGDRSYLRALFAQDGGPMAQRTLAVAIGRDLSTVRDEIEPRLIRKGMLDFQPRGRCLTPKAMRLATDLDVEGGEL